jgi:hypothetical protein|tara:strand:- start:184 stop:510 length:327 start_codon:yes stop_codon:yes gene_type:complete
MFRFNRKKLIILLIYASFFITIPIIKNETRLFEKKIKNHKNQIVFLKNNLSEAYLEYQYLSSPEILEKKVIKNLDINYKNLNISQVYLNFDDFVNEQEKITKILPNDK